MVFERASKRQLKYGITSVIRALIFSGLVSTTLYSQNIRISDGSDPSITPAVRKERQSLLVKEILSDIAKQTHPNQVSSLGRLADTLWDIDQPFASEVLSKSVELALDPTTSYRSRKERIDVLSYLLVFEKLHKKDESLAKRITAELKTLLLDPADSTDSTFNSKSIFLAIYFLKFDKELAFEFALRSLSNGIPAVDSNSTRFYLELKNNDPNLAEKYFDELARSPINNKNVGAIREILNRLNRQTGRQVDEFSFQVSSVKIEKLASSLKPFIDEELKELTKGNRSNCELTKSLHSVLARFEVQNRLVSEALEVCEKSENVPAWDKPNFFRDRKVKTSRDYIALAQSISNINVRDFYTYLAALKARDENDFRLSISILDDLSEPARSRFGGGWKWTRIQVGAKLAANLMAEKNYSEIRKLADGFSADLRPYFLLDLVSPYGYSGKDSDFVDELRERIRVEVLRSDYPIPTVASGLGPSNPARYLSLVGSFNLVQRNDSAVRVFDEFIVLQNLLASKFTGRRGDGRVISYSNTSLPKHFIELNYDHVVKKLSEIDSTPIRLEFRLNVLWLTTRNGAIGGAGITVLD